MQILLAVYIYYNKVSTVVGLHVAFAFTIQFLEGLRKEKLFSDTLVQSIL